MAERLWSGAGCDGNPDFEFVKHSDSGVPLYRKRAVGEVRLPLDGGGTMIAKAVGVRPRRPDYDGADDEDEMISDAERLYRAGTDGGERMSKELVELVAKSLEADPDPDRVALTKAMLSAGTITVEKVACELAIEAQARARVARDPAVSFEKAYTDALFEPRNVALARVLAEI
jgi:hypothetical protein